eukprot:TRINITY_DN34610_c0_g1_i1.p1 TRINITY_DN34610_c0_g1~~TRINITY_DN34610_c0_g1_i1.p1  ORF type:complete len:154 (-),score=20.46 TRINITY_DN34610_c0_g1_i1:153-560(-)
MERLSGPPGARSLKRAVLLDPAVVDVNYRPWSNEPRYRPSGLSAAVTPPIARSAFLWHYVAIPNKVASMLRDFGLQKLEETFDCQQLSRAFEQAWGDDGTHIGNRSQRSFNCGLSGSPIPCPYEDSALMPLVWGC